MAFSDFTLYDITRKLNLTIEESDSLFEPITEVELSPFLTELLDENTPLALAIHTEKARSEMLVAPILIELRKMMNHQISLFSGIDFTLATDQGLNGVCDFIVSLSPEQLFLTAPVLVIFEAKNDNIKNGLAQCMAAMRAAQSFNAREQNQIRTVFGAVTTGSLWKFLKLEETSILADQREYHINEIGKILAILLQIVGAAEPIPTL